MANCNSDEADGTLCSDISLQMTKLQNIFEKCYDKETCEKTEGDFCEIYHKLVELYASKFYLPENLVTTRRLNELSLDPKIATDKQILELMAQKKLIETKQEVCKKLNFGDLRGIRRTLNDTRRCKSKM